MLGLYLSIPFCRSKCTFCNFASGVFPASYFDRYVARLVEDMAAARARAAEWGAALPETVDTIYFGGGTPSLLPPELVRRLMAAIRGEFSVLARAEITFEAAPAQLADETLAAMVETGANRLSFGVQSFVDAEAQGTGRLHGRADVFGDVERARAAGIEDVSLDLLAGLPGQTRASWRESLDCLEATGVGHASVYMLEVDDASKLGAEMLAGGVRYGAGLVPNEDTIVAMYEEAVAALAGMGLAQYEISNFARAGRESRHNRRYWERRPYLGLGVDAHSMLREAGRLREAGGRALRFATTDELPPYLESAGWARPEALTRAQELEEAWFLGLRLNEGVDLSALRAEFGAAAVAGLDAVLEELAAEGLVTRGAGEDRVALTMRGRLLSNEVFERFLVSEPAS
uniref:Heme chaperone HemW n=1 Tax=Acidobacterium capsulatum TaxID=33075 RepID=A0A7V4XUT1_9BACT